MTRSKSALPVLWRGLLAVTMLGGAAASCAGTGDASVPPSAPDASAAGPSGDGGIDHTVFPSSDPGPPGATTDATAEAITDATQDAEAEAAAAAGCDGGLVRCGGACVDMQTDNQNCGGCGLACAGCSLGECVETIFTGGGAPLGLAVDSTRVYWVDFLHFDVTSALLDGGDVTTLATNQVYPKAIAVEGGYVYWLTAGAGTPYGTVMRALLDGGSPMPLATDLPAPQRMLVAPNHEVYWVNGYPADSGAVMRVPTDGGAQTTVSSAASGPGAITANATGLYWIDTDTSALMTAPFSGTPHPLAATSGAWELAATSSRVFWTEYGNNRVMTTGLDGGAPTEFAHAQTSWPAGIAVDEQSVYWTEDTGVIVKAPLDGGAARLLAVGQGGGSRYLAVSGNSLYWTAGSTLKKLTPK